MYLLLPWLRIFVAVLAYIVLALLAAAAVRRVGSDLKEMAGRTAPQMLLIGAVTNLLVLAITLLLLLFWDRRPLQSLGLAFSSQDLDFTLIGAALIFVLATAFVGLVNQSDRFQVQFHKSLQDSYEIANLVGTLVVLLIVALQEEVLYRGYITLNLLPYGPTVVIIASTLIFAAIHLLTNRGSFAQIVSWIVGGAFFAYLYLITGSIWIPVVLHFVTDVTNMVVFNIVGQYSLFSISPALTTRLRSAFRVVSALILVAILLTFYGPMIKLL
ncbi:MAG: CPBP family intramembrane glutamic endopeptidase [Caldilineaceae bacterium]